MTIDSESEHQFLETTQDLYWWSKNAALTLQRAQECVRRYGSQLYDAFIGPDGKRVLRVLESIILTTVLLDVDETILNLPWELIGGEGEAISQQTLFSRLVISHIIPRPGRDSLKEDNIVRIIVNRRQMVKPI